MIIYVVLPADENEILGYNTILCIRDSLHLLFKSVPRQAPESNTILTHSQANRRQAHRHRVLRVCLHPLFPPLQPLTHDSLVSLAIDEIIDDGIILETDPTIVVQRVSRAPAQDVDLRRIDLSEQGVNNLAQLGKAKFADWIRQGL